MRDFEGIAKRPAEPAQNRSSLAREQELAFAADRLRLAGRWAGTRWPTPLLRN